jgi:hypothetical protein
MSTKERLTLILAAVPLLLVFILALTLDQQLNQDLIGHTHTCTVNSKHVNQGIFSKAYLVNLTCAKDSGFQNKEMLLNPNYFNDKLSDQQAYSQLKTGGSYRVNFDYMSKSLVIRSITLRGIKVS